MWRSPEYRTRDGIIPFDLFWSYYSCMGANHARERLDQFRAIAIALACAFSKKDGGLLPSLQDELVAARLAPPDPVGDSLGGAATG